MQSSLILTGGSQHQLAAIPLISVFLFFFFHFLAVAHPPIHFFDISVYIYMKSCGEGTIAKDQDKLNFRWRLPLARPLVIRANYQTEMTGADRFEGHPKRCGRCVVREI
jgi:hypothetical protein